MALAFGFARPSRANDIQSTIGEFNGAPSFDFNPADYPLAPVSIGNFSFTIPTGLGVVGGSISGTFGNTDVSPDTAASDYFIDNGAIKVAACDDALTGAACDTSGTPTAWSYSFTSSDLSNLATELSAGSVDFTVVQNFAAAVATGTTTLDLQLSPEPASVLMFCGGLAGIVLLRRSRKRQA